MSKKLLQLVEQIIEREDVGTLFLGKGESIRHVFFSGEEVHLLGAGSECRFVPAPHLFRRDRASSSALSELMGKIANKRQSLGPQLQRIGILDEDRISDYLEMEMFEEILMIVDRSAEHFLFEGGNVPEALLVCDDDHVAIPSESLLRAVKSRAQEKREIAEILPCGDEKLILSERGQGTLNCERHWVFGEIGQLIDGFRTVEQVLENSLFFPHRTLVVLCASARQGWVRKTLFRELEHINVDQLDAESASELVNRYVRAAEMAVDDIPIRERLIDLLQRLGNVEKAVLQLNLVADTYHTRGDVDHARALYERGLALDPENTLLKDKIFAIVHERALTSKQESKVEEARQLFEECARYRPQDVSLYEEIISTYGQDEAQVSKETLRVVDILRKDHGDRRAWTFLEGVLARFPESISLRRRHVNYLLDSGDQSAATDGLEILRQQLKDVGENTEAQEIQKKIERLTPKEEDQPSAKPKKGRKSRLSVTTFISCLLLIGFGVYQQLTYQQLDAHRIHFEALAAAKIPVPGTAAFLQERTRTRNFVEGVREFHESRPATIWGPAVQRMVLSAEGRLFYLEHAIRRDFEKLLSTAKTHELRGQFKEACQSYELLERKAEGTDWAIQARARLDKLDGYLTNAQRLLAEGKKAEIDGDYEECFVIYRTLYLEYSRTQEAKGLRLPITIRSKPGGGTVWVNGEIQGKAPVLVRANPRETLRIEIRDDRGRRATQVVEELLEHEITINLH